jgi:hypothetical protein
MREEVCEGGCVGGTVGVIAGGPMGGCGRLFVRCRNKYGTICVNVSCSAVNKINKLGFCGGR